MGKYLGFLGGIRQVKSLGGFMIVTFGVVDVILEFWTATIEPQWVLWFFRGGIILGLILLIAGILASDVPNHLKNR